GPMLSPVADPLAPTVGASAPAQELAVALAADELAKRRARLLERSLAVTSPLLLLGLWEALVRLGMLDAHFFPAPSSLVGTYTRLVASGEILIDVRDTLARLAVGLALGGLPGLAIGAAMGLSRTLRAFLKPIVAKLFPI